MSKSKVDFIADLLASKKIDSSLKEKFFTLAVAEMKKMGDSDDRIWKELELLKRQTKTTLKITQPEIQKTKKRTIEKKAHDPRKTSQCLKLFKTGNKLKWITHIYPNTEMSSFNYTLITEDALAEFKQIKNHLPYKIRTFISLFLQRFKSDLEKNKFYYLGGAYETWWSKKIVEWCNNNPGLHPDTDEYLSRTIITPFKKGIEIRDGQDLKKSIEYILKKTHGEGIHSQIQIDYSGIKRGTRFFTGVDQLMTGIACLFAPIIKRKNVSNKIQISTTIEEYNNQFVTVLEILHIGSDVEHDLNTHSIFNGDLHSAKAELNSLCDWQISANFNDGTYSLSVLNSFGGKPATKLPVAVIGFTHKLIFF